MSVACRMTQVFLSFIWSDLGDKATSLQTRFSLPTYRDRRLSYK